MAANARRTRSAGGRSASAATGASTASGAPTGSASTRPCRANWPSVATVPQRSLAAVRAAVPDTPVFLWLSAFEGVEGGLDAETTLALAERIPRTRCRRPPRTTSSAASGEHPVAQAGSRGEPCMSLGIDHRAGVVPRPRPRRLDGYSGMTAGGAGVCNRLMTDPSILCRCVDGSVIGACDWVPSGGRYMFVTDGPCRACTSQQSSTSSPVR
jgi:hypothetical protein